MIKKIAITGGIGSGKSTFSNLILKKGFSLMDSDKEVSLIYEKPSKDFLNYLEKIGLSSSIKNKKINKKLITKIIFTNKLIKKKLEKYIYKTIRKRRANFIKEEIKKNEKIIFFDIPLLFENNMQGDFDVVVCIISKKRERYKRVKKSKKMKKEIFEAILKSQTTDLVRKKKSDIVLLNNHSMKTYKHKLANLLTKLIQ